MIKVLQNLQTFIYSFLLVFVSLSNVPICNANVKFRIAIPGKQNYTEYVNPFNMFYNIFFYFTFQCYITSVYMFGRAVLGLWFREVAFLSLWMSHVG